MDRSLDALAKSLADEISRRESLRRVGVLLGGGALAYFGVGCAPDVDPVAPKLVRPTGGRDVVALAGPTRFYLWESSTAPVSPAVDAGWESSAAPFARRPMDTSPGAGDNLTTISGFGSSSGQDRCHRQFISPPMAAGQVFDTSVTYKAYAQASESSSGDNIRSRIGIRIVSRDGATVRHTIKAIADYSSGAEWSTSLRNKAFLDGDAGTGSYTTVAGDRLVVEFGHRDASGSSISGSSRWGSTATGGDLPENETTTSTTVRPWFECSLGITFETSTPTTPTTVTRYVNTASTPGGNGTTNETTGTNRAFASLVTALTTMAATDWAGTNQQPRILCSGATPDTGDAVVSSAWNGRLSAECYLEIIGDQPSALAISTAHYRCVGTESSGIEVSGGGFVRVSRIAYQITVGAGSFGYAVVAIVDTGAPMDVRFDSVRVQAANIDPGRTSSCHGFWTNANGAGNKVTYTNCVAVGWTGTGATHHGFTKSSGTTASVRLYNCTAYGCANGFSGASGMVAKNSGAASCADGFSGTFDAGSTNNASNIASDAPGTNPQNSVNPAFVSAPADLHLASGDAAWRDRGVNLSADALFPFSTDGNGATRTGTWDIGADESVGQVSGPTVVNYYVDCASPAGGNGTTPGTSGANRAFHSLQEALNALDDTNWVATNQLPVINCGGSAADTGFAIPGSGWVGKTDPTHYLSIVTNQPSALQTSTSHYRQSGPYGIGFDNVNGVLRHFRITGLHTIVTSVVAGTFGWAIQSTDDPSPNPGNCDMRFDRCRVEVQSINSAHSGNGAAFWFPVTGATNKVTLTNCVAVGVTAAGTGTHSGFVATSGASSDIAFYNCDAYGWNVGFSSGNNATTLPIAKNDGATNCTDGWNGNWRSGSDRNASSLASDAPGTNPRNGVTPSFVNAPSDLHLSSGDTAWKDRGGDLSGDSRFALTIDGDGATRTGTWDIGADES